MKRRPKYRRLHTGSGVWQYKVGKLNVSLYSPDDRHLVVRCSKISGISDWGRARWKKYDQITPGQIRSWLVSTQKVAALPIASAEHCTACGTESLPYPERDPTGEDAGLCWGCRSKVVDEEVDAPLAASSGYCLNCGAELLPHIDADPNGTMNCVCARCRAEEEHDFDVQPDVEFDRSGNLVEQPAADTSNALLDLIAAAEAAAIWIDENRESELTGDGQQAAMIYEALQFTITAAKEAMTDNLRDELAAVRS